MPTMPGKTALLELLKQEGVKIVFGNPGTTELPLMDAFAVERELRYVLALQEAPAMSMADGYAQASGQLACVNLHAARKLNASSLSTLLGSLPTTTIAGRTVRSSGLAFTAPGAKLDQAAGYAGVRVFGVFDAKRSLLGLGWPGRLMTTAPAQIVWGDMNMWTADQQIVWGDQLLNPGGQQIVWGDGVVNPSGQQIVWGDQVYSPGGQQIVWGDQITGQQIVWGDSVPQGQ